MKGIHDSPHRHRVSAVSDHQNLATALRACAGIEKIMTSGIPDRVRAPLQL